MKKKQLKAIFGNYSKAAIALAITKGSISQWPEELSTAHIDRVRGAAVRLGVYRPDLFPDFEDNDATNQATTPRPMNEGVNV